MSPLRLAFRQSLGTPGFTAIVVLTLALGIGATTTIFSIINATFLRALPYSSPEELVYLNEINNTGDAISISYPDFLDWGAQQDTLSSLAVFQADRRTLKTADAIEQVSIAYVSAEFFSTLGVRIATGRPLAPVDDAPGAALVTWLTHDAWQRYLGGKPDAIGRTVSIDDQAFTVAGILPAEFRFPRRADFFVPIAPHAVSRFLNERQNHNGLYGIGRLKPGISLDQARAQFEAIGRRLAEQYPEGNKGISPRLLPLREQLAGGAQSLLFLLLGAVAMLLLITCVNVANMLLARSASRDREMAVRTALGASRWQIARQLVLESLLLAAGGGTLGCLLGMWGYDFVQRLIPSDMQTLATGGGFDWRVLLFAVGVTALTGIGFGLAPAWRLSHADPNEALKNTPSLVHTFLGRFRLADVLIVAQVALALMLLIGAGLMIRSVQRLTRIKPGFEPAQILSLQPAPPSMVEFGRDPLDAGRRYDAMVEAAQRLPVVQSAAFTSILPFTREQSWMSFFLTDRPVPASDQFPAAFVHIVTGDYFRTMGIPLLQGRLFTGHERPPTITPGVDLTPDNIATAFKGLILDAVISRRMAEQIWPGESPIGKRFQFGFPQMQLPVAEVVGIVGNTTQLGLDQGEPPELYLSLRQFPATGGYIVVRSHLNEAALVPLVRSAIQTVVKDKPILDVKAMTSRIDDSIDGRRFNMTLFTFFAGAALLLAALGLYGVLGFLVTRRTRELGIRMALGAQRAHVLGTVLWRGLGLVLLGSVIGVAGAWALSRVVESQLFGVARTDPFTYVAGAVLLLLAALVACLIPARRATRINPIEALRTE